MKKYLVVFEMGFFLMGCKPMRKKVNSKTKRPNIFSSILNGEINK